MWTPGTRHLSIACYSSAQTVFRICADGTSFGTKSRAPRLGVVLADGLVASMQQPMKPKLVYRESRVSEKSPPSNRGQ